MKGLLLTAVTLTLTVLAVDCKSREKRGSSSISLGPPVVYKDPGNHTVEVGQDFQFYCKIKANPLAHVAMKYNPVDNPITVSFPRYGTAPTGGSTIVLLDLMNLQLRDEGRYTCFAENEYGTVVTHGWLKFAKACNCNVFGVAYPNKPCDDDGNCVCRENIGGEQCDRCQEGFHNFPFCQPCDCNPWGTVDQSLSCDQNTGECNCLPNRSVFDPFKCDGCPPGEFYNVLTQRCQPCRCYPEGSVSQECDFVGGQCECKENYVGDKCTQCEAGFYDRGNGCVPCECVIENTFGFDKRCDVVTGQCNCLEGLDYTDTRTCASCPVNTFYDAFTQTCEPCGCDARGTDRCTPAGECVCKENFTGIKCDECEENHYGLNFGFCEPCECNPYGTIGGSLQCDINGNCPCKDEHNLLNFQKCDGCPEEQYLGPIQFSNEPSDCRDCECHPKGALNNNCDLYTGECECAPNVYGIKCDECMPGSWGLSSFGECQPCNCDPFNSMSQQCDQDSGQCPCYDNIVFTDSRTCSGCPTGQYSNVPGTCIPCECNTWGSLSVQCDSNGQCACQPTVQGLKCDTCKPGYFNFRPGGCDPCNCNQYGVVDKDEPCDPVTGQCNCKDGQSKISSRTCDGCPAGFYMNVNNPMECFSCDCHPWGAISNECDLYTGACDCGPNIQGDKCDECEPGFYGLNLVGIQECIPCECDPEGSESHVCDVFGQCPCKEGYGTINPQTCEGCPPGMYLQDGFCVPCNCDPRGSISTICKADGSCFCADYVLTTSPKCDTCEDAYWFGDPSFIGCIPCGCDQSGTIDASGYCDTTTGQCNCIEEANFFFLDPRICDPCSIYQYNFNNQCTDCGCHPQGSTDLQCDFLTGQCPCQEGAYGISCDSCEDGYYNLLEGCLPCDCDTRNTLFEDPTCDENGQCACKPGQAYTDPLKCSTCGEGTYQNNGVCSPCGCHEGGSVNGTCDAVTGQCFCLENVGGRDCSQCQGDTYGINSYEGCKPCECNVWGTVDRTTSCDQVTGQCQCLDDRMRYYPRTCDGCRNNFFFNEYYDPETRECIPCDCLDVGSAAFNCSTYEGKCDCNPGITGDKCDTIAEAEGDTVLYGEQAMIVCNLWKGSADLTYWIGPDGCQSTECDPPDMINMVEDSTFMSISYTPEVDEAYTCRFIFGDVQQDKIAKVDVITFELSSVTVQKGTDLTLTAVIGGLSEQPKRGIEWRNKGNSCTVKKCKIDGHDVDETIEERSDGYTLISTISLGKVQENAKYTAYFKYNGETFRKFAVVSVYECNCNLLGAKGTTCDPVTLQCDCRDRFTGLRCDQCKDEYYNATAGCLACDCDPDNAPDNICDKDTGDCGCPENVPFIDARRCEKCSPGKYLVDGACAPCACVIQNTLDQSNICADDGQCPCVDGYPYVDTRTCERCQPTTFLNNGECQDCGCFPMGSTTPVCSETTGVCDCKANYEGTQCDTCKSEFYGPSEGCRACNCDPDNSLSNACDRVTGQCECIEELGPFVDPLRCGACADNTILVNGECQLCPRGSFVEDNTCTYCTAGTYFENGACVECGCHGVGSISDVCDVVTGACVCNDRFEGHRCNICQEGYYSPDEGCLDCGCVPENSLSSVCERESGQCRCDPSAGPFRDTRTCETCPYNHIVVGTECVECGPGRYPDNNVCVECRDGFYLNNGACQECGCDNLGSDNNVCDKVSGECVCIAGHQGDKCTECQEGWYSIDGFCVQCDCNLENVVNREDICADDGQCFCLGDRPYIDERACTPCDDGYVIVDGRCKKCAPGTFFSNYACQECLCNVVGTALCDPFSGVCNCNPNFEGELCDLCLDGFYSEECVACACSPNSLSTVCDKDSGACSCPDNFQGRTCDVCVDGYYGQDCGACGCDPENSLSGTCDKDTGDCTCKPDLFYKNSRTCETCPHHHKVVSGSCVECEEGTELVGNECVPCAEGTFESFGICTECFCDPTGTRSCDRVTGSCTCKAHYTGSTCDTCTAGFYAPQLGCLSCSCDPDNSASAICDPVTGQCPCVNDRYLVNERTCELCPDNRYLYGGLCLECPDGYFVEENKCRTCDEGYYLKYEECEECRCNPDGSLTQICDAVTGVCQCNEKHQGEKCQNCAAGYYSLYSGLEVQECTECGCVVENTLGGSKDDPTLGQKDCAWTGQCFCKEGLQYVNDRTCETCPEGQIPSGGECVFCVEGQHFRNDGIHQGCVDCMCHASGSVGSNCNVLSGQCTCRAGYQGVKCSECSDGFYLVSGQCVACGCDATGSSSGTCDKTTGQCPCVGSEYDIPRTCFNCADGTFYSNGVCQACGCDAAGSASASCSRNGTCSCQPNVIGEKCDSCDLNHYGLTSGTGCSPCNCNPYGVETTYKAGKREPVMGCDAETGQCECAKYKSEVVNGRKVWEYRTRYESRTCDGCPYKQYLGGVDNRTCVDCNCHPEGSKQYQCDLYTGQCDCNPQIVGKYCDTRGCEWGLYVYGDCVVEDFEKCTGMRPKTRKEFISSGGDHTTITKFATCDRVERGFIKCRTRNC